GARRLRGLRLQGWCPDKPGLVPQRARPPRRRGGDRHRDREVPRPGGRRRGARRDLGGAQDRQPGIRRIREEDRQADPGHQPRARWLAPAAGDLVTEWSLGSVAERRARLARRHLLAAPARAQTAAEVAAAMIALHGTDPASVYLAAWARSADGHRAIGHAAVERALYQDQELLRMLGMRRTMFVVPAGVAPVIQASCTDQIAERMRSGLIRNLAAAGVAPDAGRWLNEVGDATVTALTARGTATGAELARDEPRLRTQLVYAEGKNYGGPANITTPGLLLLSAEPRT